MDYFKFKFKLFQSKLLEGAKYYRTVRIIDFLLPRPFAPESESSKCGKFAPWNFRFHQSARSESSNKCIELHVLSRHRKISKKCMSRIILSSYTIYHH